MEFEQFGDHYVLKLEPGEEVRATLTDFVQRVDLRAGYFLAFGAFSGVNLRYFDFAARQYREHRIDQQVEVVSLLGNISRAEGKPMIHMHAAVSDGHIRTFSGDIKEGFVRPTLEVFLTRLPGELRREKDPDTGLELLALQPQAGRAPAPRRKAA